MAHRLLKVIVQPVLVQDAGEALDERVSEPITVPARDWPSYPARLAKEIAALDAPTPNRAARRATARKPSAKAKPTSRTRSKRKPA